MRTLRGITLATLLLGTIAAALLLLPAPDRSAASEQPTWRLRLVSGGALTTQTAHEATDSLGWSISASISPGTGISRAPEGVYPLAASMRGEVVDGDMILVQGGDADLDAAASAHEFDVSVIHLIDWLVANSPKNTIVVLAGPIPPPGSPSAAILRANHLMRHAARQRQVRYIDALELHWNTGMDLGGPLAQQLSAAKTARTFLPPLSDPPTPAFQAAQAG